MEMPSKMHDNKKKKYGKYEDYEIEGDAETLMKAENIKQDKEKMKYVNMCLGKKKKSIESIEDLREVANASDKEDGYEES